MDLDTPENNFVSSALVTTQARPGTMDAVVDVHLMETPKPLLDLSPYYTLIPIEASEWSPVSPLTLAFTSSDLSATLMTFPANLSESIQPSTTKLQHTQVDEQIEKNVTALAWNSAGTLLVTGTFDGQMRLWTADGKLRHNLSLHRAPVLVIRWNKHDSLILSVDCTNTVVIWDAFNGDIRQTFQHISNSALKYEEGLVNGMSDAPGNHLGGSVVSVGTDADWIDHLTYATTGENACIMVYKILERGPLLRFRGHTQGINTLQFDPKTQLLASGSDDHTVRIWHGKSPTSVMMLTGHLGPVIFTRWLPSTGIISELDPAAFGGARLASASLDGTLRIWDPNKGLCLAVLSLHEAPIFTCDVSADGRFIASGGLDGVLLIWDISSVTGVERSAILASQEPSKKLSDVSGTVHAVARYELAVEEKEEQELTKSTSSEESPAKQPSQNEQINSISWNSDGTKLLVGFSSKSVIIDTSLLTQ